MRSNVKKANKASSSQLTAGLSLDANSVYSVKVIRANELDENERHRIWSVFEDNMRDLYIRSSFGWNPTDKRKELFHRQSRFLIVCNGNNLIGFSMFRFDVEDSKEVLYCYEMQVSATARRTGLGTAMMKDILRIGLAYRMEKVMLTVQKENNAALEFYKRLRFDVDETSPSRFGEEVDYEIMSLSLCGDVC